jgi:hypothetical protein
VKAVRPFSQAFDHAYDLVPGDQRKFARRQLSLYHVQIGAADGAGPHADQHLASGWLRRRRFGEVQGIGFDRRNRTQQAGFHKRAEAGNRTSAKIK